LNTHSALIPLASRLRAAIQRLPEFHIVVGFDGFVDEIISVVQERRNLEQWTPVKDIGTFGVLIQAAAGRSSLREIIVHRADPGGCAVNLGDGLLALGIRLDCFATLGQPRHPAFEAFARQCHGCYSWGREPGRTLAFEFADGKLMFSAVAPLAEFDCQLLDKVLSDGVYAAAASQAQLIALTDWTLYPHMTDCWRKLQAEVYAKLRHRPSFFLDLVDPSSRSERDVRAMLEAIPGFEAAGPTVLGVNGTEANVLARALGIATAREDLAEVRAQAAALREKLQISQVVTHCVKLAAGADRQGDWGVLGPYCSHPKKSTGAGDRFNAGYVSGLLLGLSFQERLLLGCAASGFFVRQARSASGLELADFLQTWAEGRLEA
jgi:sugar/nucleoside kinase (ribokinase family)